MAWIESHQAVLGHPKTRRLCRSLQCKPVTAIGHLHALWWWALDYAQDGTLDGYESADIADAGLWEGDPDEFFEALVASGYIDRDDSGTRLHDWWEYAGKLIQRRKDDVERKRKQAEKAGIPTGNGTPSNPFPAELQRNSSGTPEEVAEVPYVTNQPTNQPTDVGLSLVPPKRQRRQKLYEAASNEVGGYVDEILEVEPWGRFRDKGNTLDLVTQLVIDYPTADLVYEASKCVLFMQGQNRSIRSITAFLNWVTRAKHLRQRFVAPQVNATITTTDGGVSKEGLLAPRIVSPRTVIPDSPVTEWRNSLAWIVKSGVCRTKDWIDFILPLQPEPPKDGKMRIFAPNEAVRESVERRLTPLIDDGFRSQKLFLQFEFLVARSA